MGLERKLREWERAGLLEHHVVERILSYEEERSRPYALYVVGGLGALAIVLGVISVVAANWAEIPRGVKMAVDLAAVAGLAWAVHRAHDGGKPWAHEVLLILLQGLVLASIALIGQTYHLGGKPWQALLAWALMTLPAMLMGTSHASALALLVALNAGVVTSTVEWLEGLRWSRLWLLVLGMSLLGTWPLLHILVSRIRALTTWRPALAEVLSAVGWVTVLWGAVVGQHLWYARLTGDNVEREALVLSLLPVGVVALALLLTPHDEDAPSPAHRTERALLLYALVTGYAPLVIPHEPLGVLAALSFLGFCALLAFLAYQRRQVWLFNLATAGMAVRLLGIFVELFGSLMTTGLGLIVGGVVVLMVARFWVRQTRQFREQMRGGVTP
ncbi:MAG: DUF2157 domain-containing protein [Myxococcota bacterium]